jgi:hypothetical protein
VATRGVTAGSALRCNRNYRRVWVGQAVSPLGDEVFHTAIMLWLGLVAGGDPGDRHPSMTTLFNAHITACVESFAGR